MFRDAVLCTKKTQKQNNDQSYKHRIVLKHSAFMSLIVLVKINNLMRNFMIDFFYLLLLKHGCQ